MTSLMVIVPSRERPENAWRLLRAFADTTTENSVPVFVVDEDDPQRDRYPSANTLVTNSRGMIAALNFGANWVLAQHPDLEALGFMGDDHLPRTHSWDRNYLGSLRGMGTGFVYGNDLLQGEIIPTQVAMTADIVRELGWMAPPSFTHLWVDNAWKAMGEGLDKLRYLPNTVIEHMHPANGKADLDAGYERVNAPEVVEADTTEFTRWQAEDLPGILDRLRGLL